MLIKSRKGFTLVETVVAMAIVTILTIVGYQNFTKHIKEAKIVEAQTEAATLEIAIQTYNRNNPTAKLTSIDMTKLSSAGYIQQGLKFQTGDYTCTYSFEKYNNGQFTTSENHVVLKACSFAPDKTITMEGTF